MLKKLCQFNLVAMIALLIIDRSLDNYGLEILIITCPIWFNWKVLQTLKTPFVKIKRLDFISGIISVLYALSIIGLPVLLQQFENKSFLILYLLKNVVAGCALILQFAMVILKKNY